MESDVRYVILTALVITIFLRKMDLKSVLQAVLITVYIMETVYVLSHVQTIILAILLRVLMFALMMNNNHTLTNKVGRYVLITVKIM